MKVSTILLVCASAIGAIAFHPSAASADVAFSTGSQGTSVCVGNCYPEPIYQAPVVIEQRPVIIEEHNSEWRRREEIRLREEARLREERRLAERRLEERRHEERLREEARLREERRLAELRERDRRYATQVSNNHAYSSNDRRQSNNYNSQNYDRRDR